jgi:hypothetical protein
MSKENPLLRHRSIERRHVAAAVGMAPFDNPVIASLAIGMHAHLAYAAIAHGRIVEALAAVQTGDTGRMERSFRLAATTSSKVLARPPGGGGGGCWGL